MRAYGVKVVIVEPCLYKTNIANEEILTDKTRAKFNTLTPTIRQEWGETFVDESKLG